MWVLKPEWFLPGVTDQMLSEIRVIRKSWKLASPHYALKSESDEIVMPWFTMHNCLCLKSKLIVFRVTPWWSFTITTSMCRNCTWQSKGWHSLYFIYNLLNLTKNLMESCERFCPTNSFLFHVLKCLLWETPSWASSRQTNEKLFHKMLRVEVLDQLLLLTEAPHTVAALKELSLRPRWLSFICILWRSADHCQGWINSEYCCIQIRDLFLHWNLTFVLFSVSGLRGY